MSVMLRGRCATTLLPVRRRRLTHVFGRLDPAHSSTSGVLQTVRSVIEDIPRHRLQAPDTAMWGEAGILAGELFRLRGAPKGAGHERKYLNDALIYIQARGIGASVLTGNVGDFDFLNQLVPGVRIIVYRQAEQCPQPPKIPAASQEVRVAKD
jgi:hypothetical protein